MLVRAQNWTKTAPPGPPPTGGSFETRQHPSFHDMTETELLQAQGSRAPPPHLTHGVDPVERTPAYRIVGGNHTFEEGKDLERDNDASEETDQEECRHHGLDVE